MNKKEKVVAVDNIISSFKECKAVFVFDSASISAQKNQKLRKSLIAHSGKVLIAKNTLLSLATEKSQIDKMVQLKNSFSRQIGLVFAFDDIGSVAKLMQKEGFGKEVIVHSGVFNDMYFDGSRFEFFANLPSIENLYGKLCSVLLFSTFGKLVNVLNKIKEKKENNA